MQALSLHLDYVVVKIPRLPFDKFIKADHDTDNTDEGNR